MERLGTIEELKVLQFRDYLGNIFTWNMSTQGANRTGSLPALSGPDRFVFANTADTLLNKTFTSTSAFGVSSSNMPYLVVSQDVNLFMSDITEMLGHKKAKGTVITGLTSADFHYALGTTAPVQTSFQVNASDHIDIDQAISDAEILGRPQQHLYEMTEALVEDTFSAKFTVVTSDQIFASTFLMRETPFENDLCVFNNTGIASVLVDGNLISINGAATVTINPGDVLWLRYISNAQMGLTGTGGSWYAAESSDSFMPPEAFGSTTAMTLGTEIDTGTDAMKFLYSDEGTTQTWMLPEVPGTNLTRWFKNFGAGYLVVDGNGLNIDNASTLILVTNEWAIIRLLPDSSKWVVVSRAVSGGPTPGGLTMGSYTLDTAAHTDSSTVDWLFVECTYSGAAEFTLRLSPSEGNVVQLVNHGTGVLTVVGPAPSATLEVGQFAWFKWDGTAWQSLETQQSLHADVRVSAQVASGSYVTEDTMVEILSKEETDARLPGTPLTLTANALTSSVCTSLDSSHIVVAWLENRDIVVQVLGVVGAAISQLLAETVILNSRPGEVISICAVDASNFVICWPDLSFNGQACVVNYESGAFTVGTPVQYSSYTVTPSVVRLTANTVLVGFGNGSSLACYAAVGTISGTSISFGDTATVQASNCRGISCVGFTSTSAVIVYFDDVDTVGNVLSIAGDVITVEAKTILISGATGSDRKATKFDATRGVIVYKDASNYGAITYFTKSGTTLTAGTIATPFSEAADSIACAVQGSYVAFSQTTSSLMYTHFFTLDILLMLESSRLEGFAAPNTSVHAITSETMLRTTGSTGLVAQVIGSYLNHGGVSSFSVNTAPAYAIALIGHSRFTGTALTPDTLLCTALINSKTGISAVRSAGIDLHSTTQAVLTTDNDVRIQELSAATAALIYGLSNELFLRIVSVDNNLVSYGEPIRLLSTGYSVSSVVKLSSSLLLITIQDAIVAVQISGNSATVGPGVALSGVGHVMTRLSDTSAVLVTTSTGKVHAVTVASLTITLGTEQDLHAPLPSYADVAALSSSVFVAAYVESGTIYARRITVSGTDLTLGDEASFDSGVAGMLTRTMDSTHVALVYIKDGVVKGFIGTVGESLITGSAVTELSADSALYGLVALDTRRLVLASGSAPSLRLIEMSETFTLAPMVGPRVSGRMFGYAIESGVAGDLVQVSLGSIIEGLTGLEAGKSYYVSATGLSTKLLDTSLFAGTAVSSTQLYLRRLFT